MSTRGVARWPHERDFQTWNKDFVSDPKDLDIGYLRRHYRRCLYIGQRGLYYLTSSARLHAVRGRRTQDGAVKNDITQDEAYWERASAPRKYRLGRLNLLQVDVSPEKLPKSS